MVRTNDVYYTCPVCQHGRAWAYGYGEHKVDELIDTLECRNCSAKLKITLKIEEGK